MTNELPPAHHLLVPSGRTLVHLATARAAMVISVRVFAPGTRGATPTWGPAAGIHQQRLRQPVQFASLLVGSNGPEANNLGTGLGAGGITPIAVDGRSFPYGSDPAVIGAHKVGAVICNGQWVQFNIQVPS
ncbi:MAG: hypothetical protein M0027_10200, partial [Candidatus Dormibacteraeota bacterium]|nr:hypothetical protein [Candidatus Dormibacteraeota bacterium]